MSWYEFRRRLWWLYYNRNNITYMLGAAGQVAGRDPVIHELFVYYYNNGWKNEIGDDLPGWRHDMTAEEAYALWINRNANKMCFDCSGLIDWCIGYEGVHKYSSSNFAQMPKNESVALGPEMSILYKRGAKSGHVAIDIGAGYCMEIGEFNHTIEFNKISDRHFDSSHKCAGVDYSGADNR